MKIVLICLALSLLTSGALGQGATREESDKSDVAARFEEVPAGTALAAELAKTIDGRKVKVGDPVTARTTQDMLANGKVVIPRDSRITGHITDVQGRPKGQKGEVNSTLGIAFDKLAIKGGGEMAFHASVQAMARPVRMAPAFPASGPPGGYGGGVPMGGTYPGQGAGIPPTPGTMPGPGSMPGIPPSGAPGTGPGPQQPGGNGPQNPASESGAISTQSQGVIGMKGFSLSTNGQGSVISSTSKNVKLEGGTQLILKTKEK